MVLQQPNHSYYNSARETWEASDRLLVEIETDVDIIINRNLADVDYLRYAMRTMTTNLLFHRRTPGKAI
jgi:hypothetical protein